MKASLHVRAYECAGADEREWGCECVLVRVSVCVHVCGSASVHV